MLTQFTVFSQWFSMEFLDTQHPSRANEDEDDESLENEDGSQLLAHQAAATGNVPLLMEAVNHDPSALESQDEKGMTPLSRAVVNKHLDMVKLLVKMGADINTQDALGRTPLCLAAYEGWHHGVVYLLRSGGKQSIADRNGRLPLHAATYDKDSRSLSALLQTLTIGDVNEPDNDGMTALHWAAFHNRPEHVQLLMLRGGDLFSIDVDGKTPLHWASQNGCIACCSIMAKCRSGGAQLVNMFEGTGKSCVHLAAAAGYSSIMEEFVDVPSVDFESLDPDDRTPLHWAAASAQVDCVEMLLQLGVEPSPRDINGGTPLDYAKQAGNADIFKLLQQAGAQFGTMATASSKTSQDMDRIGDGDKREPRKKRFGFITEWFNRRKNGLRFKSPSEESEGPTDVREKTAVAKATTEHPNYATDHGKPDHCNDLIAGISKEERSCDNLHPASVDRTITDPHNNNENISESSLMSLQDSSKLSLSDDLAYTRRNSFPVSNGNAATESSERSPRRGSETVLGATPPTCIDTIRPRGLSSRSVSPLPSQGPPKSPGVSCEEPMSLGEIAIPLKPLCRDLPDADTVQRHAQEILDAQRSESWLSSGNSSNPKPIPSLCGRSISNKNLYVSSVPKLAPLSSRPALSPGAGDSFLPLSPLQTTAPSQLLSSQSDTAPATTSPYSLPPKQAALPVSSGTKYGSCPSINQKGLVVNRSSNVKSSRLESLQPIQPHTPEKYEKKKKKKKSKPMTAYKLKENDMMDSPLPPSSTDQIEATDEGPSTST